MVRKLLWATLIVLMTVFLGACGNGEDWKGKGYDLSLPRLGEDGWYEVFTDNFDGDSLNEEIWTCSPHCLRWETQTGKEIHSNHWCDDMVTVADGYVTIRAYQTDSHNCSRGICPRSGRFSGGIETRRIVSDDFSDNKGDSDEMLFSQAYGYFETRVKFPDAPGLWAAFWLQSSNQRKVGHEGRDGTEIDVFESAFRKKPHRMGHALLWDGYGSDGKVSGHITDLDYSLYGGFNTFALKWTPEYYVFYINGVPTWATNSGGVSRVRQFLRLTVEIDAGDTFGPHGQRIGHFNYDEEPEFVIDYVKVYQNSNYEEFIMDDEQFPGELDYDN
ncbi:MAG: glycoside hydrolase family 16 protein [Firmicutes bacterium]|nr:glycoside hydrolase family 16 protein [Bacillota bacterium]